MKKTRKLWCCVEEEVSESTGESEHETANNSSSWKGHDWQHEEDKGANSSWQGYGWSHKSWKGNDWQREEDTGANNTWGGNDLQHEESEEEGAINTYAKTDVSPTPPCRKRKKDEEDSDDEAAWQWDDKFGCYICTV